MGKLCRQRGLLAGLALLCLLLPLCIAPAAEYILSQGVSFSGITLAITGPEGDPVPQMLESALSNMNDISRYCQVRAMDYDQAMDALEQHSIHAVLVLPEDFVGGIMHGSNPDVTLIVPADRPLESLLTLWVGQSASDLLAAVQSGIYTVLELYAENPPAGLSYDDVVTQINLRYVNWTINRQALFQMDTIAVTEQLPIGIHYALSLLCYLALAAAPFFGVIFDGRWIFAQRRFRAVGRGAFPFYLSSLASCWILLFPLLTGAQLLMDSGSFWQAVAAGALCSFFCAAFVSLCCLLTSTAGTCGLLAFSCSLVFLALSGGILPPVLMPKTLRSFLDFSPITWMRNTMAGTADFSAIAALVCCSLVMVLPGALLYRQRSLREEVSL